MLSDEQIREAARSNVTDDELRMLIDAELGNANPDLPDLRLMLAADLLCDAAMEVAAKRFEAKSIQKTFVQGNVEINYSEMAIVADVDRNVANGKVSEEELNKLLLKGSVAHVVSQAIENGVSEEDIASGSIATTSLRLTELQKPKKRGFLSRLFDRS